MPDPTDHLRTARADRYTIDRELGHGGNASCISGDQSPPICARLTVGSPTGQIGSYFGMTMRDCESETHPPQDRYQRLR